MWKLGLLATALLLALPACQTVYKTAGEVSEATTIEYDAYEKTTWVQGPIVTYSGFSNRCFLRTLVSDSGVRVNQLYVVYRPSEWAFLERAHDRLGNQLDATVIDRDVSRNASLSEHVAVRLGDAYLEDAADVGLDIQVSGDHGSTVVRLPAHYVHGYLQVLAGFLARSE